MQDGIPMEYGVWGALALLIAGQALWSLFFAYPAAFERMLRRGRNWVYVPLAWRGARKLQVLAVARLLTLGITASGVWLFVEYSARRHPVWVAAFVVLCYAVAAWLQGFWTTMRYRQQEDGFFLRLDTLRAKMEQENKDFTDTQLRSLASYQHQQSLRKADEERRLLAELREVSRRQRQARPAGATPLAEA